MTAAPVLRLATRRSRLALVQADLAIAALAAAWPRLQVAIVPIISEGDRVAGPIAAAGGRDLFTRALQDAMLAGKADAACHSLKDLGQQPDSLVLAAVLERGDPRDALVGATVEQLKKLPGPVIATSSPRRAGLVRHLIPSAKIVPVRGNVETRLRKLDAGDFDAMVLACAGLDRLGLGQRISQRLDPAQFVPAPGQAIIGLECRSDDRQASQLLAAVDDADSRLMAQAERACSAKIGGDCHTPLGAHARIAADSAVEVRCVMADADACVYGEARGSDPVAAGENAVEYMHKHI